MPEQNPPLVCRCLVVLVGPPASGKTTWARQNGRGAIHVSQDDLIETITPDGFDHVYRSVYYAAENAVAQAALEADYTVIVDRTNRTREHRKRWLRIAAEARSPVAAVVMPAAAPTCLSRNSLREGPRRLSDLRMERMLAALEPVCQDEGFSAIFDGESSTLTQILDQLGTVARRNTR
jgi:predicted kinase